MYQNMHISQNSDYFRPPGGSRGSFYQANYNDVRNLNGRYYEPDTYNLNLNSNLNRNLNLNQKASPSSSSRGSGPMYQKKNFFSAKNIPIPVLPANNNKK